MRFTVPQFIEHEPKIIGSFTFKQFAFIGSAGALCFVLYFTVAKGNFLLFLFLSLIIGLLAISLAFVKINGKGLPIIIVNFFKFSTNKKIFLWKKKTARIQMMKRVTKKITEEKEDSSSLKFAEKSRLKKLSTEIETKL
ncbi:PrgI family mobile element protein [Patescibacteria group bacterium]